MNKIFADTQYWIALINPKDQWRARALSVSQHLNPARLITTDEVLIETLNYFAERGAETRLVAATNVEEIMSNRSIEVKPCNHKTLRDGLALYQERLDKGYSLTDCISMNVMREYGITDVLPHDHHFTQEGFRILL